MLGTFAPARKSSNKSRHDVLSLVMSLVRGHIMISSRGGRGAHCVGQMHTLCVPGGHALFLPSVARQGVKASDGRLPREHLCAAGGHRSQSKSTNAPGSDRARAGCRVPGSPRVSRQLSCDLRPSCSGPIHPRTRSCSRAPTSPTTRPPATSRRQAARRTKTPTRKTPTRLSLRRTRTSS